MTRLLGALATVLLLVSLVLGYLVWGERADRADALADQDRYGQVLAAARDHVGLLVDLRHDDPAALEALADGSTDRLAERYSSETSPLVTAVRREESVSEGAVVAAGVVMISGSTATVLVATDAEVTSRATDGAAEQRDLRLRVDLVREDERWLVDDIEALS